MYTPKTSNAAVKRATGKEWQEWFTLLDKAGAKKMAHIDIARMVHEKYLGGEKSGKGVGGHAPNVANKGGWWAQTVTVEYERSRGLRAVNQLVGGFSVTVHRTLDMPMTKLFTAWRSAAKAAGLTESAVHAGKSIRYKAAEPGGTYHHAMFAVKPGGSRIGLVVMRLPKKADVERERAKWKRVLESL